MLEKGGFLFICLDLRPVPIFSVHLDRNRPLWDVNVAFNSLDLLAPFDGLEDRPQFAQEEYFKPRRLTSTEGASTQVIGSIYDVGFPFVPELAFPMRPEITLWR